MNQYNVFTKLVKQGRLIIQEEIKSWLFLTLQTTDEVMQINGKV